MSKNKIYNATEIAKKFNPLQCFTDNETKVEFRIEEYGPTRLTLQNNGFLVLF